MPVIRRLALLPAAAAALACGRGPAADSVPATLNTAVAFAPACRQVAFSSNRDGRFLPSLLHLSPTGEAAETPLRLGGSEDFFVRSFSADCGTLALVADRGGRGTYDVFLYEVAKGRLRNLTGSDETDDGDPEFAPAGSLLALLSGGALVLYDAAAGAARPVPPGPVPFAGLRWAPEGDRVYLEDDQGGLWEYSLPASRFRSVWTPPRPGASPRMVSSRGDRLYFISDHETDVTQVYRLHLRTGGAERVHPSPHDQYSPVEQEDGSVVFRTNVDGSFLALALRGGRADTLSPRTGVVYDLSLRFGRPLLVYAGHDAPASLYGYDPAAKGAARPLVALGDAAARPRPRVWRSPEGMPHFLYLPAGPVRGWVVWLHGGPHEQVSPRFNPYYDALVARGYAVAALNYPGSTGIGNVYELRNVPEEGWVRRQVDAVEADLRALRRMQPDFGRYAVVGVSYGASLAQVLARRQPDQVRAVVDFSGMLDGRAERHLRGGSAVLPPALFIYGRNDPAQQSPARRGLVQAYASSGTVERLILPDEGHYVRRRGSMARIIARMTGFLDEHAGPEPPR